MGIINRWYAVYIAVAGLLVHGCAGVQTFPNTVRPGATAVVAAGWKHDFSADNITVTITPSAGAPVVYLPGDPAVRGVINFYPDPLSWLVVGTETGQSGSVFNSGATYGQVINYFTGGDKDWWQTTVFVDLPVSLAAGTATIDIVNQQGDTASSSIEVLNGVGNPDAFVSEYSGPLNATQMASMGRSPHFKITFVESAQIPYAIQLDMSHDPDIDNGGVGVPYVVNPRGDVKSVTWSDDGAAMRVLLTPTRLLTPSQIVDFKFYVAGGITGLQITDVKAFDINGSPVIGVAANVTPGG